MDRTNEGKISMKTLTAPGVTEAERASEPHVLFSAWMRHFIVNRERHAAIEAGVDWTAPADLTHDIRAAFVRSFQRFELGEGGDGGRLLRKAGAVAGVAQLQALRLLVREEQLHSELFLRGLRHLAAPTLDSHWSDRVFTALRRALGLRTELALFLTAEAVAMPFFVALAAYEQDEVIRTIGRRIVLDEQHHVDFQIDQLAHGFATLRTAARPVVFAIWTVVAIGATAVLALDHAAALRACGLRPVAFAREALRSFRRAARASLWPRPATMEA